MVQWGWSPLAILVRLIFIAFVMWAYPIIIIEQRVLSRDVAGKEFVGLGFKSGFH